MSLAMNGNIGIFRVTKANRAMDAEEMAIPSPSGFRTEALIRSGSVLRPPSLSEESFEIMFGMLSCRSRTPANRAPPRKKNGTWVPGEKPISPCTIITYEMMKAMIPNRDVEMLDQSKGACPSRDPIIESGILFRAMYMDLNSF